MEEEKGVKTNKGVPSKTLYFIIGLIVVVAGLLFIAVNNLKEREIENPQNAPAVVSKANTILSIIQPVSSDSKNYTSSISIDTGSNKITAVALRISYDPKVLQNVDILPGTFIASPTVLLKNIDTKKGLISLDFSIPVKTNGISGQGAIAEISFTKNLQLKSASTKISFEKDSMVTAEGVAESVLKGTYPNTFSY